MKKLTPYLFFFFLFWGCEEAGKAIPNDTAKVRHSLNKKIISKISPGNKIEILDSVLKALPKNSKDTLLLWSILRKSNLLHSVGKKDSILYYDKLLYTKALEIKSTKYLAISSYNIGYDFMEVQRFDSAYHYYNTSKNYCLELGDSLKVGRRLLSMAQIQKDYNDLYGAKETVTNALEFLKNPVGTENLSRANDLLGTLNRKLLNFEDAFVYHEKAIEISTNDLNKTGYKNNLALVYRDTEDYSKAISIYKEILEDSVLDKNSSRYARVLHNLTYSKWKNKGIDAEKDFLYAMEQRKKTNDFRGLIASYTDLGEFYSKSDPKRAKLYLDSLVIVSREVDMPRAEVDALKLRMVIEPKNITVKDRLIFLKDSLYQQELKVKTQFAKMKYDDEQEKSRLLVLEAETAQQEVQLAQQEIQKILFLSFSTILLMGGVSLYFFT